MKIPKSEAIERITLYLNQGLTYRAMSERLGLSPGRICQIAKDFGLKTKRCLHCSLDNNGDSQAL